MSWYRQLIVIDDNGCSQIEYTTAFTKLLSRI